MAQRKPKKPLKYPKKFRAVLEKLAGTDAERATAPSRDPMDVIGRELLLPEQVHFSHHVIDHEHQRLTMEHQLFPPEQLDQLDIKPPWILSETQASP